AAWKKGDKIAAGLIASAQESLADDAVACARLLIRPKTSVHFILAGSILLKQPQFTQQLGRQLQKLWPGAVVSPLERESVWGAVELAHKLWRGESTMAKTLKAGRQRAKKQGILLPELPLSQLGKLSPTEQRHSGSLNFDKLPLADAIELMLSEDAKIPGAVLAERKKIEQAVRFIAHAFKQGGR